jgi:transposase
MYCDVRQWRHIRRRILEQGMPKKRVAAETGISRKTINKMLAHEQPPGYRRRRSRYPKLAPHIHTIDRLLNDNDSFPLAVNMKIQDIVEHLRREEGFAGSYDSVWNYIHRRAHDDESSWERAYYLIINLPKPRALDFIRRLSRGYDTRLLSFNHSYARPHVPECRQRDLAAKGSASCTLNGCGACSRRSQMRTLSIASWAIFQTFPFCFNTSTTAACRIATALW